MGHEPPRTAQPVWMVETPVVPYTPPESLAPAAPSLIAGRYALGEALGRGGHASVWEAEDRVTRTKVALKRFHRQSGPWTARIRREIAALRMLRVPGVVQLLDEGVDEEGAYVVMERVQGAPFPGAEVPVSWERLRPTLIALLETFARIHARGVVHRDIKPGNILVRGDGTPVVLDFGIARWDLGGAITNHGEVLGTPLFLAPEQLQGEPVTPATDLYALGAVLFGDSKEAGNGYGGGVDQVDEPGHIQDGQPCYGTLKFQHRSGAVKGKRSIRPPILSLPGSRPDRQFFYARSREVARHSSPGAGTKPRDRTSDF